MDNDDPIVVSIEDETVSFAGAPIPSKSASEAAAEARGSNETPQDAVTYGRG